MSLFYICTVCVLSTFFLKKQTNKPKPLKPEAESYPKGIGNRNWKFVNFLFLKPVQNKYVLDFRVLNSIQL